LSNIFKTIRKKRNKRRLSVLWLFLITIELFCPALCGNPTFAAETSSPSTNISRDDRENSKCEQISVSDCQSQNRDGQQQQKVICNDECLCHAVAMHAMPFSTQKPTSRRNEKIAFLFSNPIFNSLPPPHRPPKNS
jgi:hypothetical protein